MPKFIPMKLYSTNNKNNIVSLKEAVFKSLPEDRGLYMPVEISKVSDDFIRNLSKYSFQAIAFEVARTLIGASIPEEDLYTIVERSITFPAPVIHLDEQISVLELFHGPSLAFKDFGARFMAQLMSYLRGEEDKKLTILVATSGDTGGAVASGFYNTDGVEVIILYPSGKVSALQEKQLTTLGGNITAIEVDGTFDDCQAIVKTAFLDSDLNGKYDLSSANSINIARLIPQIFYYFEGYKQLPNDGLSNIFCVPSGNFGNLTAGLIAKRIGLPIHQFIAATNINRTVPEYLSTGLFQPHPSYETISNAMDVGNPSNFSRMLDLYSSTWNNLKEDIYGFSCDDETTKEAVAEVYNRYGYTIDPHGAVGYAAAKEYLDKNKESRVVILETAHPAKFLDVMNKIIVETEIAIPERLGILKDKEKRAILLKNSFDEFKDMLMSR